ncbi:carboxylesterase/lipase family protein [Herbiconiux sp. 11R-BC]|uniref:carboxylesterase/lipase family protein n=1 Tax=Herbiconiux sp. 11R-BC TaxID=3111637 RepID=UPI003C0589F1
MSAPSPADATPSDDALLVTTSSGPVRGSLREGLRSWRGIPYAAAPVGALRFRRPQPPEPWQEVRETVEFGHAAPQHENKALALPEGITQSEDCLVLNVLAPPVAGPDAAPSAPRPVMVWVHGGAYFAGTAAQPLYDGTHLVQTGEVVFVSVNYRLGALGFLDFSGIATEEQPFDTNLGLRDLLAALSWVQQNIAAFGGDPGDVTLFGESAGGGCVTTLLTSPHAAGLFHRAIAESSPATSVYSARRAAATAARFLEIAGVPADEPQRLRELPAEALSQAAFDLVNAISAEAPGTLALAPVVDGDVVPVHPIEAFQAGTQHPLPLIIGTNRDEASLFRLMKSPLMPITPSSVHAMFAQIAAEKPALSDAEARVEAAYPKRRSSPAEISRDAGFRMPSIWLASAHSRVAPTRMYRFDHATPMLKLLGIGATHGAELAYVFGNFRVAKKDFTFDLGGLRQAERVSAALQHRWLRFAVDGVPAGLPDATGSALDWPLYDVATRSTLVIDHGEQVVDDPDAAIREAWGDEVIGFD